MFPVLTKPAVRYGTVLLIIITLKTNKSFLFNAFVLLPGMTFVFFNPLAQKAWEALRRQEKNPLTKFYDTWMTIQQQTVDYEGEGEELESTEKEPVSENNH